jgi:hypothetical protein
MRPIQRGLQSRKSLPEDALPPPPMKRAGRCNKIKKKKMDRLQGEESEKVQRTEHLQVAPYHPHCQAQPSVMV